MSEQAPAVEIPAEDAYAAAVERAVRTTRALILAEAQVATLERQVAHLTSGLERVTRERDALLEQDEEVKHDGASDDAGAAAGGEVGLPHPVHGGPVDVSKR